MKEMYGDQFGEFVCGYRGLKGQTLTIYVTDIYLITDVCVVCGWWGKFVILCLSCFMQVNVKILL